MEPATQPPVKRLERFASPGPLPLDILQETPYRRLVERLGESPRAASQYRRPARDARPAHPEGAVGRAHARMGRRAAHSTDLTRCAAGEPGLALPRPASSRAARLDRRVLGRERQQPAGQVLPPHGNGAQATASGARDVASLLRRDRTRPGHRLTTWRHHGPDPWLARASAIALESDGVRARPGRWVVFLRSDGDGSRRAARPAG